MSGLGSFSANFRPRVEIREELQNDERIQQVATKRKKKNTKVADLMEKIEGLSLHLLSLDGYTPETYPEELLRSQSENLVFDGILISGYTKSQAVKTGTPKKFGVAVGYQFKWMGEEPLKYVYSKILDSKGGSDSISEMGDGHVDVRQVASGSTFTVTRAGMAILLNQPMFSGVCNPGVMLDGAEPNIEVEYLVLVSTGGAIPYLRHRLDRTKLGSSGRGKFSPRQKPMKDYPIYIAEIDGVLDTINRVDVPLKPMYQDQFGICAVRAKKRSSSGARWSVARRKLDQLAGENARNLIYGDRTR